MIKKILSPLLLLSAAIMWGFAFVAQDKSSEIPPFTLGAARSIIAGVFLILIIIILDKVLKTGRRLISKRGIDFNRRELIGGAVCGVVLALASLFQQMGINAGTDGGKAAFITALYVVLVPIYALVLKKRATLTVWIAVGISVIGFYLLCIKEDLSILPSDLLCLVGSALFPIHILTIDCFSSKCDGVRMSCIQFFSAAIFNGIMALILERPVDIGSIGVSILPVLYLGIVSSGIAYTLQIVGQKDVPPAAASIILSLESVFGVIGAALILHTKMSSREYIGCAIVFSAVILSQIDFKEILEKRKSKKYNK